MPTEGTAAIEGLQAGLSEARRAVARCDADAQALDAQARELLARRGAALAELARRFLPEVSRETVAATFAGIRGDLEAVLNRKEHAQADLQARLADAEAAAREHESSLADVTRRLDAKVAERENLEAQVAATLKADDDFQQRSKLALQAEEQLHRYERRVAEVETEAAAKLPAYESSRLFQYLYGRGYGTPAYTSGGLTAALDRWVSRLIGFPNARNGYEFLKKTPALMRAEVERRRAPFTELMQQVEALQRAAADQAGLTDVLREGEELGRERDRTVAELEQVRRAAQQSQAELTALGQAENAYHAEALERLRQFLGETKVAILAQRAKQTPEPEDDAVVADIAALDRQLAELKPRLADAADRRAAADRVRDGLDVVIRRFRQANYDGSRSYFDDPFDLREVITRFETGELDVEGFWSSLREAQKFRPHWVESAGQGTASVLTSPTGRVILGAVLDVANTAMRDAAYRGVRRRSEVSFPGPQMQFPWPMPTPDLSSTPSPPPAPSSPPPDPVPADGSFTTMEGF